VKWGDVTDDPYATGCRARLSQLAPGLADSLECLPDLEPAVGEAAVRHLLSIACQAQHSGNIMAGRRGLLRIPRVWLLERLRTYSDQLDLDDEWEFRRYVEATSLVSAGFAEDVVVLGRQSANEDVRDAAEALAGRCAELSVDLRRSV
jgi:hypothetical protein